MQGFARFLFLVSFAVELSRAIPLPLAEAGQSGCSSRKSTWTATESTVWLSICQSGTFDFNKSLRADANPDAVSQFSSRRSLSGKFIETILAAPFNKYLKTGRVEIIGAWITGSIDLSNTTVVNEVFLEDSRIDAFFRATGTIFSRKVSFQGSTLSRPLDVSGAVFQSSFYLGNEDSDSRHKSEPPDPLYNVPRRTLSRVLFEGAHIDGDLYIKNFRTVDPLIANNAIIKGHLILKECSTGEIQLESIEVGKQLNIVGCAVTPSQAGQAALDLAFARVKDGVWLNRSYFGSDVRLNDISVDRGIFLSGADLHTVYLTRAIVLGVIAFGENTRRTSKEIDFTKWSKDSLLDLKDAASAQFPSALIRG